MKLTYEGRYEYLKKVYASWLGKVIGVQLGSPVENWTSAQIEEKYPDEEGYLVNCDVYAADDDLNGPLFFVRSLLDHDEINAEKIGQTMLNYLQEYRGFFWWGGVGVSTEHTAYENLKNGIKAPQSGSMMTNGQAIAEQIGGQIFSRISLAQPVWLGVTPPLSFTLIIGGDLIDDAVLPCFAETDFECSGRFF